MSGKLSDGFTLDYIREQAERLEELAYHYPQEFEHWQGLADEWRMELPPADLEPGPVIDAEFIELGPAL